MNTPQTLGDGEEKAKRPAQLWLDRIAEYRDTFSKWDDCCEKVGKLYSKRERSDKADREYSMFWANIEVLKPAVYARPPIPVVATRFKDGDPVAREASDILERCLTTNMEQADIDALMRLVRDDMLLYSRATAWVRYVDGDKVEYDWVNRKDFAHSVCRVWPEVKWVARRAWLTREEGVERFGDAFKGVQLKKRDPNAIVPQKTDQAPVWEVWSKSDNKVIWVAEDFEDILDESEPLFSLKGFFPCPRPAYGTLDPESLVPVPEFVQYKDQVEEINEYTARIAALSDSLKMKGFYQAGAPDVAAAIERAFKANDDSAILVPVTSAAALGSGAFKDAIVWLPVAEVAQLINTLVELRRVVIDDIYQLTGISDIVRGSSQASETATAQSIKAQWGSQRIRERQLEIVRFARDLVRIAGEIMAEHFAPETIRDMAQSKLPTSEQLEQAKTIGAQAQQMQQPVPKEVTSLLKRPAFEQVIEFLQNDRVRSFVIEVETDSTIQPDEDAEKKNRIEFVTTIGGMIQQTAPIVMQQPMLGKFAVEAIKFAASSFRSGRPLEQALDELSEQIEIVAEQAMQPKPPPVDPKVELEKAKLQMQAQAQERQFAFDQAKHEQEMQFAYEKHAAEMNMKQQDMVAKREQTAMDMQMRQETAARDMEFRQQESDRNFADKREAREMSAKPALTMQVDAQGAVERVAATIEEMAQNQTQAMAETTQQMAEVINMLAEAVQKIGGPRRKTAVGPSGKTYQIVDEAAE